MTGARAAVRLTALALLVALTCAPNLFEPLLRPLTSNGARRSMPGAIS